MSRGRKKIEYKSAIAIVGEGKTEQIYFTQLRNYEQIGFTVKPELPKHSDIRSIVNKAIQLIDHKGYDVVFCVFDLDEINDNKTIKDEYYVLKRKYNKGKIIFIENNPCIEFWFLIHYQRITKIFNNYGQLEKLLKQNIPDYQKTEKYLISKNIYTHLKEHQSKAKENAEHGIAVGTPTSSKSEVHLILDHLKI